MYDRMLIKSHPLVRRPFKPSGGLRPEIRVFMRFVIYVRQGEGSKKMFFAVCFGGGIG